MADRTIDEQLTKYLTDAHSIEEQALAQLRRAPDIAGDEGLASAFREHQAETEGHERRVRELIDARDAALGEVSPDDLGEQVTKYLTDAHAIEKQSIELLERSPTIAGSGALAGVLSDHLEETREHERRLTARLHELDASASKLKDAAL